MLSDFFSSGLLNLIYIGTVLISFIFVVLSLIGSEIGDALDFDVDGDSDVDFINISTFALAMFGATFGLVGLVTRLAMGMDAIPSIIVSLVFGLVVGILAQLFFLYVLSPTRSSHYLLTEDAIGRFADVIISIPASGRGKIAYDNVSGRVTLGARSLTGESIPSGEVVIIENVVGRLASVLPAEKKPDAQFGSGFSGKRLDAPAEKGPVDDSETALLKKKTGQD